MKTIANLCLACLLIIGCKSEEKSNEIDVVRQPMEFVSITPSIVGPFSVSSELPEFACAYDRDRKVLFFNRTNADRSEMKIMTSRWFDGKWQDAEDVSFSDDKNRDIDPFLINNKIYFTSNRGDSYDIYSTQYDHGKWTKPNPLSEVLNSDKNEVYSTVTHSGNIYFTRFSNEKRAIFRAIKNGTGYKEPERILIPGTNGEGVSNPAIHPDERYLVFSSGILPGSGGSDLFISHLKNEEWTEPVNLGSEVNSDQNDFAPSISTDGKLLFFTSERPGILPETKEGVRPPGDIYVLDLEKLLNKIS